MLILPFLYSFERFLSLFVTAEGCEADVALAGGAEADTGGADDVGAVEQLLEELPGGGAVGYAHPDVGGVLAAVALKAGSFEHTEHTGGVLHVVVDGLLHLLLALGRVDGLGGALGDIAGAVELGTLAAEPELVEGDALALEGADADVLGDDGVAAADAGEACGLRERAELDGTLAGAANLVDAVRDVRVLNVSLVGGIEEDEGIVLQGVVHPLAQFLAGDDGARRVVGIAEVDDVDGASLGQFGNETVLGCRGHVAHVGPAAVAVGAAAAYHDVGVDVDGIDGVGDADEVVPVQQLLEVAGVALGAVVDEDFVDAEADATRLEVVLQDGLAQEVVALLGSVATEAVGGGHLVNGTVHGLDDGGAERLGDVADAERDDVGLGVHHTEGVDLLGDVGEEVVLLEVQEVDVY